ncbi:MAG TPA: HlyD family efflux transporter periplasmic adaptor subunit [Candidatus Hydrogenedentes bacterium]|nr:HlyD family efflux transporter periplasmic adaptor subunit [Candidatus Hydrogenedentota bacterium]
MRRRTLPLVVWLVAIAVILAVRDHQMRGIRAVGMAELREVIVAPLADGRLEGVTVDILDGVNAGDVVAVMDTTLLDAVLATAEQDTLAARAELEAARVQLDADARDSLLDEGRALRNLALDHEEALLDLSDREVEQDADAVRLKWLGVILDRQKALAAERIIDQTTIDETSIEYESLKKKIEQNMQALALARQRVQDAEARQNEFEQGAVTPDAAVILEPLQRAVEAQRARADEVRRQVDSLVLKAPATGQVRQVLRHPGETVLAGQPVVTIAPESANRVVAYAKDARFRNVEEGAKVLLSVRTSPARVFEGTVVRVGAYFEPLPLPVQLNPNIPEWGVPLLIADLPPGVLVSGEVVDVRLALAP